MNRTHQLQLLQQARQKIRESSGETVKTPILTPAIAAKPVVENQPSVETDDDEEEFFYEDEIDGDEKLAETTTTNKPKEENKPVILTSNFFLPGKPLPKLVQQDFETQEPNDLTSDIGENQQKPEDVIDSVPEEDTEPIVTVKKVEEKAKLKHPATTQAKPVSDDPTIDYVYEYEDYTDEPTTDTKTIQKPTTEEEEQTTIADDEQSTVEYERKESDVTVRSEVKEIKEVKSTKSSTSSTQIETSVEPVETSSVSSTTEMAENAVDATESYRVVASVQTSRSISGARFLPFPQVEQEEKKQSLSENKNTKSNNDDDYSQENASDDSHKADDLVDPHGNESAKEVLSTQSSDENVTEVKNDGDVKTRVHKLSSVSEKLAHLHELNEPKAEVTTKSVPVVIRKFSPRTTKVPPRKPSTTTARKLPFGVDDELASLLPPGYKYRANNMSEATTPIAESASHENDSGAKEDSPEDKLPILKNIQFKEISVESLLPKDYQPPRESKTKPDNPPKTTNQSNILSKIKFEDDLSALLPKDYKPPSTTKAPFRLSTVTEDINKFLPPGYKLPKESSTTKRPLLKTTMDDISKFLPPGYKVPKSTTTEKPEATSSVENILNKLSFNADISSLLPPGFKSNASADDSKEKSEEKAPSSNSSPNSNFKLVFPKGIGIGKRPGIRLTTSKPSHVDGPTQPGITIRKGLPTR